jgi:hypothetical protein
LLVVAAADLLSRLYLMEMLESRSVSVFKKRRNSGLGCVPEDVIETTRYEIEVTPDPIRLTKSVATPANATAGGTGRCENGTTGFLRDVQSPCSGGQAVA